MMRLFIVLLWGMAIWLAWLALQFFILYKAARALKEDRLDSCNRWLRTFDLITLRFVK